MFRKEAIDYKNTAWDSKVIMLPSIPSRYYVIFSICSLILIISYIIFGTYTRRINVIGEIVVTPYPIILESPKAGYIDKVFVNKGQKVVAGDNLFLIIDNKFTPDYYNQDISTVEIDNLAKQITHTKNYINTLNNQISLAKTLVDNLKTIKDKYQILLNSRNITQQEFSEKLTSYLNKEQEYKNLLKEQEQSQIKLKELENLILDKKYGQSILVKSPIDGIIESVDVTNNQAISSNKSLGTIKPIKGKIKLVFWVPNDAVPYIKEKDEVKIRYFAFPYEKFGQFKGNVSSISTIPASASEISLYKNNIDIRTDPRNPLYKVEVNIEKKSITNQNKTFEFFNGMQAETTFFLEKRKIYQWIFSPLYYINN